MTTRKARILDIDTMSEEEMVNSATNGEVQTVWTYRYQPFRLGPAQGGGMMFPMKTWVKGEVVDLLYGYKGFVFQNTQAPGLWHVALVQGGALIGHGSTKHHAIASVLDDMKGGDRKLMKQQVELSVRKGKESEQVARGEFMRMVAKAAEDNKPKKGMG